jgi:quercetin dioxygenase-like cupin family protein
MKKLLIGVFISALFTGQAIANDQYTAKVEELANSTLSWEGSTLPEYPEGQPEIRILKITIPPKAQLPLHKHPVINAGLLTKGELKVFTENKEHSLSMKAGDTLIEVVDKWHYGRNEGDVPAEIVVFYAGTKGAEVTVAK